MEGGAATGTLVFNAAGSLVGVFGEASGGGFFIISAGVEATFSFGSGSYRIDAKGFVVNADGSAVGDGLFTVSGGFVFNSDGVQVGVVEGDANGEFYIVSNGGSGLAFSFQIGDDGTVLDEFGFALDGFTYRSDDGAVIDGQGDIRAFFIVSQPMTFVVIGNADGSFTVTDGEGNELDGYTYDVASSYILDPEGTMVAMVILGRNTPPRSGLRRQPSRFAAVALW